MFAVNIHNIHNVLRIICPRTPYYHCSASSNNFLRRISFQRRVLTPMCMTWKEPASTMMFTHLFVSLLNHTCPLHCFSLVLRWFFHQLFVDEWMTLLFKHVCVYYQINFLPLWCNYLVIIAIVDMHIKWNSKGQILVVLF